MRAAQYNAKQHAREYDVVGVTAVAKQEAWILDATDRLGEAEFGHERCLRGLVCGSIGSMHALCVKGQEGWKIIACAF
jgi:hypothetical protein